MSQATLPVTAAASAGTAGVSPGPGPGITPGTLTSMAAPVPAGHSANVNDQHESTRRVDNWLKLLFAIQCCLGGLVLRSGENTEEIPIIAAFFAIFGYVFVDVLRLFALPPVAAYMLMGLVALFCVGEYWQLDEPGQPQMVAVGNLLVYVQSILMLQQKTRRIFEQLLIFSLLELVVAAVFNSAIYYGFLLVPMSLIGVWTLCLMSIHQTWDGVEPRAKTPASGASRISVWSPATDASFSASAMRYPRLALAMVCPSIIVIALIFFYALPRIGESKRNSDWASASVGFSGQLTLGQMGRMLLNPQQVMRFNLYRHNTVRPYRLNDAIYLRGKVFENYSPGEPTGDYDSSWVSTAYSEFFGPRAMPIEFVERDPELVDLVEHVDVEITCEANRTIALFAIAPYHRRGTSADLLHSFDAWTIERLNREPKSTNTFSKLTYQFGTHAFFRGTQGRLLTMYSDPIEDLATFATDQFGNPDEIERELIFDRLLGTREKYVSSLLAFDEDRMPTVVELSQQIVDALPNENRNPYETALALESFLRDSGTCTYTLNLDFERIPGVDPIEQFLSVDRSGHCQYFASALAMMLRSQGIPARVVAGYNTDEFNELGNYFVVRQLHAHAWVEALVPRSALPLDDATVKSELAGQVPSDDYWLRLDPTPISGRENRVTSGGVSQVMDLAKNMWDEYVVDMDKNRQDNRLLSGADASPVSDSYASMISWVQIQLGRIRNGELGGGALAGRQIFSIPAAILGVGMVCAMIAMTKVRGFAWVPWRRRKLDQQRVAEPKIPFFAETLKQLARLGLYRQAAQTPAEFTQASTRELSHPLYGSFDEPLSLLTNAFYQTRFGKQSGSERSMNDDPEIATALRQVREGIDRLTEGKTT